jgi:hypothetical protein
MLTQFLNKNETLKIEELDFKEKSYSDIIGSLEVDNSEKLLEQLSKFLLSGRQSEEESNL